MANPKRKPRCEMGNRLNARGRARVIGADETVFA